MRLVYKPSKLPVKILQTEQRSHAWVQLARNKRLDSFFVRDLNAEPDGWALPERSFDAVLCCVSVQYLQKVWALPLIYAP